MSGHLDLNLNMDSYCNRVAKTNNWFSAPSIFLSKILLLVYKHNIIALILQQLYIIIQMSVFEDLCRHSNNGFLVLVACGSSDVGE